MQGPEYSDCRERSREHRGSFRPEGGESLSSAVTIRIHRSWHRGIGIQRDRGVYWLGSYNLVCLHHLL